MGVILCLVLRHLVIARAEAPAIAKVERVRLLSFDCTWWPQYRFVQMIALLFLSQLIILEPSGCQAHTTTDELLRKTGLMEISAQLTTYPSPKRRLTLTSHLSQNCDLGEGRWPVTQKQVYKSVARSSHNEAEIRIANSNCQRSYISLGCPQLTSSSADVTDNFVFQETWCTITYS